MTDERWLLLSCTAAHPGYRVLADVRGLSHAEILRLVSRSLEDLMLWCKVWELDPSDSCVVGALHGRAWALASDALRAHAQATDPL